MKRCCRCKRYKLEKEFNKKNDRVLQGYCKQCQSKWYRKYYQTNPKEKQRIYKLQEDQRLIIRQILDKAKDVPCSDCRKKFHPCAMDFDHVGGV